jgi:CubicO group peptidase (beta-lactamase class C family)
VRALAADPPAFDAAKLALIPQRMQESVQAQQISGAVTLFACEGETVQLSAVGQADIAAGRAMQQDTIFAIASMTKPITATAVMMLRDAGKLRLEDPVAKYVPAFAEVRLKDGSVPESFTIWHLMTHTSGLGGSQQIQGTLAESVDALASRPLDFEPGTRWQYSPGLNVCGRIVEVISGKPLETFLAERIFQPLGMRDTTFFPDAAQQQRLAQLYRPGEDGAIQATTHWLTELTPDRSPNPSGGLFSTAQDLARFYQLILNGGLWKGRRLISADAVRDMTRLQTGDIVTGFTPGNGWGLGWCVVREPQGVTADLSPGSFGHGGAFGTQGWIDPRQRRIFVLLIQRTGFGNSDASDIRGDFQRLCVQAAS